jgi:hypothetical protein
MSERMISDTSSRREFRTTREVKRVRHRWSDQRCRILLLAALGAGLGCESQPPAPNTVPAAEADPRSPRIKKRDALHPEKSARNTSPGGGRQP